MYKDISIEESFNIDNPRYIDLRSEKEYLEDTIPGAVNISLFDNKEREQIGMVYKNDGHERAKLLGIKILAPKMEQIYRQIRELAEDKCLILFCWRGGMRSKFMASVLSSLGMNVSRIKGGYKSYRRFVYNYINKDELSLQAVVLHGLTGVGKTQILQMLSSCGLPVLDLESIAANKGSVFGKINMPLSPTQKQFESSIVNKLRSFENANYYLVECEGKRLGKLIVPLPIVNGIKNGRKILLYSSIETRVRRIKKEYVKTEDNIEQFKNAIDKLKKRLGNKNIEELKKQLEVGRIEEVIEYLLLNYYDPLYKYPGSKSAKYDLCVDCRDLSSAVDAIHFYLQKTMKCNRKNQRKW